MKMKRISLPGRRKKTDGPSVWAKTKAVCLAVWRRHTTRPPTWGRVKTACIAALLVCNVLLLAVLGCVKGYDMLLARRTRSQMDALLAQKGVLCGSSVYHTLEDCPQVYTLRADSAVQKAFAETLLTGNVTSGADKGNTMVWSGENGTVSWAASGEVSADVELHSVPEPQGIEQAENIVKNLLNKAGISVRDDQLLTSQVNDGFIVEVKQQIDKMELLGCSLTITISEGNETNITGRWCTGEVQPLTVRALESYSPQQMVFLFVASQEEGSLAQIISAQPVYVLSDKSGGRFTAVPCWRFSTDSGDYVLNILTGDVVASTDLSSDTGSDTDEDQGTDLDSDFNDDASDTDNGESADDEAASDTGLTDGTEEGTGAAADSSAQP